MENICLYAENLMSATFPQCIHEGMHGRHKNYHYYIDQGICKSSQQTDSNRQNCKTARYDDSVDENKLTALNFGECMCTLNEEQYQNHVLLL